MILVRRRDGTIEFQVDTWDEFRRDWLAASPRNQVLLEDPGMRRPAVRRDPDPFALHPGVAYVTPSPRCWAHVKQKVQAQAFWSGGAPRKRDRLCAACGAVLTLVKEIAGAWCFRCEVCHSVETWGKSLVGGTEGAGEPETRPKTQGADLT